MVHSKIVYDKWWMISPSYGSETPIWCSLTISQLNSISSPPLCEGHWNLAPVERNSWQSPGVLIIRYPAGGLDRTGRRVLVVWDRRYQFRLPFSSVWFIFRIWIGFWWMMTVCGPTDPGLSEDCEYEPKWIEIFSAITRRHNSAHFASISAPAEYGY